jgi:hypothetical protein
LEKGDEFITNTKGMLEHAVEYYKIMFGKENRENVRMVDDFWDEEAKVTVVENEMLELEFTKEEIKKAIDDSYAEGGPGPNDFSFLFYQNVWIIIKYDLMALVRGFWKREINIARLNYAMIILIPKEEEAKDLKKFRPINLINCSFKIFSKTPNNR